MTRKDFVRLVKFAQSANFDGSLPYLSECASRTLHHNARAILPALQAAALLKWQAFQFNGQWDPVALTETYDWMHRASIIFPDGVSA